MPPFGIKADRWSSNWETGWSYTVFSESAEEL
jgi:hypothetical protein